MRDFEVDHVGHCTFREFETAWGYVRGTGWAKWVFFSDSKETCLVSPFSHCELLVRDDGDRAGRIFNVWCQGRFAVLWRISYRTPPRLIENTMGQLSRRLAKM